MVVSTETKVTPIQEAEIGKAVKMFGQIQQIIKESDGHAGALIRILQQTQNLIGYLPPPVLKAVSRDLKVPLSEINGIVSFYHFFTTVPKGRHVIQICTGTSCYVKGAGRLMDVMKDDFHIVTGKTTDDGRFSLEPVRCLGCCGLAPVISIDGNVHGKVKVEELGKILSNYE